MCWTDPSCWVMAKVYLGSKLVVLVGDVALRLHDRGRKPPPASQPAFPFCFASF